MFQYTAVKFLVGTVGYIVLYRRVYSFIPPALMLLVRNNIITKENQRVI